MRTIFCPGHFGEPYKAEYEILLEGDGMIPRAHIVVVQSSSDGMGPGLWNTDKGRDAVLNSILNQNLKGIRLDFIRFTSIMRTGVEGDWRIDGLSFPIRVDIDDYVANGNPCGVRNVPPEDLRSVVNTLLGKGGKEYTIWSHDVVAGCAKVFTDFDTRERIERDELNRLIKAVGLGWSDS